MYRRLIALLLIITLVVPLATGCGGTPQAKETVLVEGVLSEELMSLAAEGVSMEMNPVNLETEAKATISRVSDAPPLDAEEELPMAVYDFKLEGADTFPGVAQLVIPLELGAGELPGAAWYNEETKAWEPVSFRYDSARKAAVIATDHFSKYGVFTVSKAGMRKARLEFLGLADDSGGSEEFLEAINEYTVGGVPAGVCRDIGIGAAGDAMQLGSDVLGNLVQGAGFAAYGDDVLSTVGDSLGRIGLFLSVVQVGNSIYNGKINDALVGSMKTALSYVLGKVASKMSTAVMSASMASVAIVDYSINKFGTEALAGRASIYRDAYSLYYQKNNDGYKSSAYWYKTFYPLFASPSANEEELKQAIDKIVTAHCQEFWTGTNKLGVDYYVSEAREQFKWTAGGAGLNKDVQDEISAERRAILYNDILPGVFQQIAYKLNLENERMLRAEYKALSDYLNQNVAFSVVDDKKAYSKHPVRFAPLNDKAVTDNWTGKFKDDGSLSTGFTLYGHMAAGAPNTLEIFKPDADIEKEEPLRVLEFTVTPPEVEIVLGEEIPGLKYAGGDSEKILQFGLNAALKQADVIKVDKEGNFSVQVEVANASGGSGNNKFSTEVRGFNLEGKIDPGSLSGTGSFTATMTFTRKEISPLQADAGETKEFITTTHYEDNVSGTVKLSGSGSNVTLTAAMEGFRNGFTKLQHHAIYADGKEIWGDNPTVTDKSGEVSGTGVYRFTVQ